MQNISQLWDQERAKRLIGDHRSVCRNPINLPLKIDDILKCFTPRNNKILLINLFSNKNRKFSDKAFQSANV